MCIKRNKGSKPTAFLLLGDTIDGESVSHWQRSKKKRPPVEYQLPAIDKEIEHGNKGLDEIDEVLQLVQCARRKSLHKETTKSRLTTSLKKTHT